MEQIQQNFIKFQPKQWSIAPYIQFPTNGLEEIKLINKITKEQFLKKKIIDQSSAKAKNIYAQFVQRSTYPLPGTPKIIIISKPIIEKTCSFFKILVQTSSENAQNYIKKLSTYSLLQVFQKLTFTLGMLVSKCGSFRLTKKMLAPTSAGEILLWVNEDFSKNSIQIKEQSCSSRQFQEKHMLLHLLTLFSDISSKTDHQNLFHFLRKKILEEKNFSIFSFNQKMKFYSRSYHLDLLKSSSYIERREDKKNKGFPGFLRNRRMKTQGELSFPRHLNQQNSPLKKYQKYMNDLRAYSPENRKVAKSMLEFDKKISLQMSKPLNQNHLYGSKRSGIISLNQHTVQFSNFGKNKKIYKHLKLSKLQSSPCKSTSTIHQKNQLIKQQNCQIHKENMGSTASCSIRATCFQSQRQINPSNKIPAVPKLLENRNPHKQKSSKIFILPKTVSIMKQSSNITFSMQQIESDINAVLSPIKTQTGSPFYREFVTIENQIDHLFLG